MMNKKSTGSFKNIFAHPKKQVVGLSIALALVLTILYSLAWTPGIGAQGDSNLDLASISVTDQNGTTIDIGTFAASTTSYTASVASTVERVTVEATAKKPGGVRLQVAPADSQTGVDDHQVDLNYGKNLIVLAVHSYSYFDSTLRVYTVEINRAGSAPQDAVSNVKSHSVRTAKEGSTVPFLFTRTGDSSEALEISVDVWKFHNTNRIEVRPGRDRVSIQQRVQVEFSAGSSSVILNRNTPGDSIFKGSYYLGVTAVAGSGYQIRSHDGYASTLVWEDDYDNPTLASLSLRDQNDAAVAFGEFDPDTASYTGSVASEINFVTVIPSNFNRSMQTDILPPDSKPGISGHQVDLHHGDNLIAIAVRSGTWTDGIVSGTYQLEINRAGTSSGGDASTVSVYGISNSKEGIGMPFLLTRDGNTTQSLTVPVNVSEIGGDMVDETSKGRFNVEFKAGDAWAMTEVPTNADSDWEEHSTVTMGVVAGELTEYALSSVADSASSTVKDDDVPAVTAALTVDSNQPQEGEVVTATLTIATDGPKEPHNYVGNLAFRRELGTAQPEDFYIPWDSDYSDFPAGHRIIGSPVIGHNYDGSIVVNSASFGVNQQSMQPVETDGVVTHYQKQISVPILIVDDGRPEADETFDINVEWGSYHQSKNPLTMDQGITSRTITIPEHDDTPAIPNPISYITVGIADSGSAGSTYTFSWHDTAECASYGGYWVYLIRKYPEGYQYLTLGTTAVTNTQLTASTDDFPLSGQRIAQVKCGDLGRLLGEVPLPSVTQSSVERPVPGTYSSQPALTSLTVSPGTLGPAFSNYGFLYSVLDVPHSNSQITLNATARSGYTISWDPSQDADTNTAGHQVNLDEGYNSIFVSVDHDQGINSFTYEIIVKGAALTSQQANTPATGSPSMSGIVQVGQTLTASTTGIADTDGLTNAAYSYQWVANDGTSDSDIADATASAYSLVAGDAGKTIKVKVTFTDDGGNEETLTSAATAAVAATMPAAPVSLSVSVNDTGRLDVSWSAPGSNGGSAVTGYKVQWKEAADSWDTPADVSAATVTGTSHTVSGLTDGVEYTFRVFAVNTMGDSPASEEESGTPRETTAPAVSSATVDGATLTLTFSEVLTETPLPAVTTFTVNVGDNQRGVDSLAISGSTVTLTLASAVTSTDAVTVGYTVSADPAAARLMDLSDNSVASFNGQAATNNTAAVQTPLTASVLDDATTHDGQAEFTFDLRFSENLEGFSYKTLRDHAFTVTGGTVTNARRLAPPSNIGWEIRVRPTSNGDVTIVLPITTDCTVSGGVCTGDGRKLSNRLELIVSGPTTQQISQPEENTAATGAPTISGTVQVGETLTADTSGIADADGLTNVSYNYRWVQNDGTTDSNIQNATGTSYNLVDTDEGKTIKVKVSFTDDGGNEETLTSTATAAVAARPNSPATGTPTISGTVQVGETLTADTSGIADADGLTNVSYNYRWVQNDGTTDSDIQDATGSSYSLVDADEGKTIKVKVSFTDDVGNDETMTSASTEEVAAVSSPLTVSLESSPASHNGTDEFTFQIRFSEEFELSYVTLRDHAFTVVGGTVKKAQRQVKFSNIGWTITVEPASNAQVEIMLPATNDCASTGAICTVDGRTLSNSLEFTVSGPGV